MKIKIKTDTGVEEINDTDLPSRLVSENIQIPKGRYDVIFPDGDEGTVPAESLKDALAKGYKFKDSGIKKEEELDEKYSGGVLNTLESTGLGVANGLTMGAANYALKKLGYPEERLKEVQKRNPISNAIGEYGSTLAALVATGGGSAVAKVGGEVAKKSLASKILASSAPALLSKAGDKIAAKATGELVEGLGKAAATGVIKEGIEGAGYGLGDLLSEAALGDAELTAENLLSSTAGGAVFGGMGGGTLGVAAKGASKYAGKAKEVVSNQLAKLAESGDAGILKWAGANKGQIKKLLNTESLDAQEMSSHILGLTNFGDTVESIVANGGISKSAGKGLLKQITTNVDEIAANNQIVKDASTQLMTEPVEKLEKIFLQKHAAGQLKDSDIVSGPDLAKEIEEKFVKRSEGLFDPQADEIQKFADQLKTIGVSPEGEIIPLTPRQLREQSIIFGRLAKFEKMNPTGKEDAYRALRQSLEEKIVKGLKASDDSGELFKRYMSGKKLYQKAVVADDMIQNKIASEIANNRGLSITEGLAAATGAAALGPIGAVAGYAARKAQREYGDIAVSAILSKIQQRALNTQNLMNAGVKQFFKDAGKGVQSAIIKGVSEGDYESSKKELEKFQQNPYESVQTFNDNNGQLMNAAPKIGEAAQNKVIAGIEFLKAKFPQPEEMYFNEEYTPPRSEVMKFNDYRQAINNPAIIYQQLKEGYINPRSLEVLKTVYPKMYLSLQDKVLENMPKKLTRQQRIQLQMLLGAKVMPAMDYDKLQILQRMTPESQKAGQLADQQLAPSISTAQAGKMKTSQRAGAGTFDQTLYRA